MIDEPKTCWQSGSTKRQTPWGYEVQWASLLGVNGKVLFLNKGHSTSLKYYKNKNEVLLVRRGRVRVLWGDENSQSNKHPSDFVSTNLKEGDTFCIQSGCPYRLTALEDSEVFEIGDQSSTSDSVMIFDDYGRVSKNLNKES